MSRSRLIAAVLVSLAVAVALALPLLPPATPGAQAQARAGSSAALGPAKPKLVVVIVADQFRNDNLTRFEPYFGKGGFRRLLRQAARLDGHHGQQNTYTGPGHALLLSGSYGYRNGITQNKWFNRLTGKSESMAHDPGARYLDGSKATVEDDTSPRNFIGSTVADELLLGNNFASRAVFVTLKERGAILLGGVFPKAYWFSEVNGGMTSSSYYMQALPPWAVAWNGRKLADSYFGKSWERLLPEAAYAIQGPDEFAFENNYKGLGRTFPHKVTGKLERPGEDFYAAFTHTPFSVELELSFAAAAIDGEQLGKRGVPDLLGVSLSASDFVGHAFGVYSHEYQDLVVRMDRALEGFFGELDRRFRPGEVLVVFTSDHGAVPIPEYMSKLGLAAHRMKKKQLKEAVTKALAARFGEGEWVLALEDPSIYLNHALVAERKLDPVLVERVAGEALLSLPGLVGYFTRTQLLHGAMPPTQASRAIALSYFPPRGGDVVAVQRPFSFWGKYAEKDWGGTHGSFNRFDTDVPLLLSGPWFKPGYHGAVEMIDLAATLAHVLGVQPPANCEGIPIERVLR